jgi:hypothetical protein
MRRLGWLVALVIIASLPNLAHAENGPSNNWGWGWEHHDWDRDRHDQDRHDHDDRDRDHDRR